jgi:uncharacterized protein with von Willebrand factor type A (vWA) domain
VTRELDRLVGFGRLLRTRGLPVGTGRILSFCRAVAILDPITTENLYWAARSTLISSKHHLDTFERCFDLYFGLSPEDEVGAKPAADASEAPAASEEEIPEELELAGRGWHLAETDEDPEGEMAIGIIAGRTEVLRNKSFEELTDEERGSAAALIRRLAVTLPRKRDRRLRPSSKGSRFDLRRTLRYSLRTQGEPFHRAWRQRRSRMRPLVLILDVSGSMSPYSRALMQFGFAAMAVGQRVEVFCFGTRLTRVTKTLRTKDPDRAMKDIAGIVRDWEGGTRIGDSLHELLGRYGQHGFLRGAVVVLCSDGLERGDPDALAAEMSRLARLAHKVVWVNPLKGSPLYQPLARGMSAALPHVDVFLPGHNVASLEALGSVVGA